MKTSLGQLYLMYYDHKNWFDISEKLKSLSPYSFGKQYKTSYYLDKNSVEFRFICLSLFCNMVLMSSFPLYLYCCSHLCTQALLPVLFLFTYFIYR